MKGRTLLAIGLTLLATAAPLVAVSAGAALRRERAVTPQEAWQGVAVAVHGHFESIRRVAPGDPEWYGPGDWVADRNPAYYAETGDKGWIPNRIGEFRVERSYKGHLSPGNRIEVQYTAYADDTGMWLRYKTQYLLILEKSPFKAGAWSVAYPWPFSDERIKNASDWEQEFLALLTAPPEALVSDTPEATVGDQAPPGVPLVNRLAKSGEWIPLVFATACGVALLVFAVRLIRKVARHRR